MIMKAWTEERRGEKSFTCTGLEFVASAEALDAEAPGGGAGGGISASVPVCINSVSHICFKEKEIRGKGKRGKRALDSSQTLTFCISMRTLSSIPSLSKSGRISSMTKSTMSRKRSLVSSIISKNYERN